MTRWLAPEVIQTSAMDCGPAALKSLLDGHGRAVSYGRLREACQTDVDGTSIDTLEDLAVAMGLDAEQVIVPVDHVTEPSAALLPALIVVRLPNGLTHFVVAWRRTAGLVQVMDPGRGRRWPSVARFLEEIYRHQMGVPAADWREFAGSDDFLLPLGARLRAHGLSAGRARALVDAAVADPTWQGLAALDAAARMVSSLRLPDGDAASLLAALAASPGDIPEPFWSARASKVDGELLVTGAVMVRVKGVRAAPSPELSPLLLEALREPPPRPMARLWGMVRGDGLGPLTMIALALPILAALVLAGDVLLRSFFDLGRALQLSGQRAGAIGALIVFATGALLVEGGMVAGALRAGRRLEARLRLALLDKLPRTADRYFRSRLVSDLATRAHALASLRGLPPLAARVVLAALGLGAVALGLGWLVPEAFALAGLAVALALLVPFAMQPTLVERDLRARSIGASLSIILLDGLLGLAAVRAHRAERTVRRAHEALLVEQARAGLAHLRVLLAGEAVQGLIGALLCVALVWGHADRLGESGAVLLFVYWVLGVPALGSDLAGAARQVPGARNITLRLLEPLDAPEEALPPPPGPDDVVPAHGAEVRLDGVELQAGGHTLITGVTLRLAPGSQVAIVGRSGAGKSSLAGALLGLHRPSAGTLTVDGQPLDEAHLERLRRHTVWIDPAVQLWNRSLYDNLCYGNDGQPAASQLVDAAELGALLERLPDGLQTPLGEGGALVSGGEGQRVRLGRALARLRPRLAILDEPFRGLDRDARRRLTARARVALAGATMLYISHDVGETQAFDRVLVVEDGRVIEDGPPAALSGMKSRYRDLLDAEEQVRRGAWSAFRKLRLDGGKLR